MGERKGVNKYYPPDWDPSKGSINQYVGQHPLRDRAKKLGQGILVIRFEMPYNIWCGGCNSHIGMGVRYNAEKSKTGGMYYTTPIYKFRMKCHLCPNYFEIVTDPKNHDYVIVEGARRKEQRWDPKENEQIVTEDKATQKKMATDAMFKLEHGSDDIQKGKKAISHIGSLEARREDFKDDYMLNKLARQKFRDEKKAIKAEAENDSALLMKSSLDIPLQKETEEDVKLAALIKYRTLESYDERQAQKRKEIESRPLFLTANKLAKIEDKSPENKKLDIIKKNIRTARTNTHTSPFDRMNMNTIGGGCIISKQSIGIRRKSLPIFTNPVSKGNEGEEHKNKKESENVLNERTKSDDSETVEFSSKPTSNHCGETNEAEDNLDRSENSRHTFAQNLLNCGSCSKLVSQGGDEINVDCSPTCVCDSQSALCDNSSCIDIAMGDGTDRKTRDSEKEGVSVQLKPRQSALGQVCAYSDTDSDT